jgi:hypothetical protein
LTIKIKVSKKKLCFLLVIMVLLSLLMGCAAANYGAIRPSREVNELFESYEVLDNHNYYYSGSAAIPNAIIGIHENFTLKSDLWKPVDLTQDQLKKWILLMTNERGFSIRIYGYHILDPQGAIIGVWYSPHDRTVVKMVGDQHVVVHTPTVRPGERDERFRFFPSR